jgi:hypothetical protein
MSMSSASLTPYHMAGSKACHGGDTDDLSERFAQVRTMQRRGTSGRSRVSASVTHIGFHESRNTLGQEGEFLLGATD